MSNTLLPKIKAYGALEVVLLSLAAMLFIAALIVFIVIYSEGDEASNNAQELLTEYERKNITQKQPTLSPAPSATYSVGSATYAPTQSPQILDDEFRGYVIIGKLEIEGIDVVLPIIAQMNTKSLKVSVCYYKGELPTEPGNLVITGHNYSNGAHFGRLDEVEEGDVLVFTSPDHTEYKYEVYETLVIKPDQAKILDDVSYEYELTLFTCYRRGNRRFVVRAKLIDD